MIEYTHKLADGIASVFGHGTDYPPPRYEPTRAPVHPAFEHR